MESLAKLEVSPVKRAANFEESSSICSKIVKLEDTKEEEHFLRLFINAVDYVANISNTKEEDISTAIVGFMASFKINAGGAGFSEIDLNVSENLCGYLFRYGALSAGLVRKRLLQVFDSNQIKISSHIFDSQYFLKFCQAKTEISVISLGGGPGNDIIGLCSALYEVGKFQSLNLTVVDSVKRWASCFNIIEFLVREDNFGNVSKLYQERNVISSFICCELPGQASKNKSYFKSLQEADLILMARLWSILPDEKKQPLIDSIAENMKKDSLLIFIDTWTPLDYFLKDFFIVHQIVGNKELVYNFSADVVTKYYNEASTSSKAGIIILKKKTPANL